MTESFTPTPLKGKSKPVMQGGSGMKNIVVDQGLLKSIILPLDSEKYISVSSMTLANHYVELHY